MFIFPDPIPILPNLHGFSVRKKPTYKAGLSVAVSGREIAVAQQAYPVWEFELTYEALREQTQNSTPYSPRVPHKELMEISQVFLACRGAYGRFYFEDVVDNSRTGQLLGVASGSNSTFRAVRTWGGVQTSLIEPVGGVNTSVGWSVYLNGFEDTANWTLDSDNINFVRNAPPDTGTTVTADFSFYYFCRFLEDMVDFEQFNTNLWSVRALRFKTVKN